jgi:signal transduction histidine kinase
VARPLRRLTLAAVSVADLARTELVRVADSETEEAGPPKLSAVQVTTSDEIGDLATAFNRVQATAALLMEQQVASRRNVAVMFANIAKRTRSLVSRQLTFIDDLERDEQDEQLLAKLYRLDHLTTRLHRSADSLLVISGIRDEDRIISPAPLVDVVRSAIAEIEGYQAVTISHLCAVVLSPEVVADLRLIMAELMENATAFSPPGSPVEIGAVVDQDVKILIVDHGIGMSAERLADENRRLVERERLDVVPTSMLGLFVVGRLARRHGLRVHLTPSGGHGLTAEIRIPRPLYSGPERGEPPTVSGTVLDTGSQAMLELPRYPSQAAIQQLPALPVLPIVEGSFEWFTAAELAAAAAAAERNQAGATNGAADIMAIGSSEHVAEAAEEIPQDTFAAQAQSPGPTGLARRNPGGSLQLFGIDGGAGQVVNTVPVRDPEAERSELDAYSQATAAATAAAAAEGPPRYPLRTGYPTGPVVPEPAAYPVVPAGYPLTPPPEYPPPRREDDPTAPPQPRQMYMPQQPQEYPTSPPQSYQSQVQAYQSQVGAYAAPATIPMQAAGRGGLIRRVPGAQLAPSLRSDRAGARQPTANRNAEAERDAMQSFLDGLARAEPTGPVPGSYTQTEESEKR